MQATAPLSRGAVVVRRPASTLAGPSHLSGGVCDRLVVPDSPWFVTRADPSTKSTRDIGPLAWVWRLVMFSEEHRLQTQADVSRLSHIFIDLSLTFAVAESLTGGMLTSRFAAGPQASSWLRGGLVAYHSGAKREILGVSEGPVVSERAAREMARGAATLFGADITVAVTGAGGPDGQDGEPPGTVWCAVRTPTREMAALERFRGNPGEICEQACARAIALIESSLE